MKIGIIGCGSMGSALAERLCAKNDLLLHDRNPEKMQEAAKKFHGKSCAKLKNMFDGSDMIILSIKPKDLASLKLDMPKQYSKKLLLASTLTGISIQDLQTVFGTVPILRMMPNLAISCGNGVVGLCANNDMDENHKKVVEMAFSPLGLLYWLPEARMDALTSLTGSGPGFACVLIEAMVDAAIAIGFSANEGRSLVFEMLKGTLSLLESTGQHPGDLKWKITSPQGTTIAGIRELEAHGVRSGIIESFVAAYQRARQMQN